MAVEVYLDFDGNCREAVEFYASVFRTETPEFMTYGEAPQSNFPVVEQEKDFITYTELRIFGSRIMFSDVPSSMKLIKGNNFSLTVTTSDKDEIIRLFNEFKKDGEAHMEPQKTFWSELYCVVTDKFGIMWQFSHSAK